MKYPRLYRLFAALAMTLVPFTARAHVRVFPDVDATSAPACSTTVFTVRVPVEKPVATTGVDVFVPKGVIVLDVQPKPGWRANLVMTRGVVSKIQWRGGHLYPHEFDEFAVLAALPKVTGTLNWDAWQYYEDGSIVKWTGAPHADTPHSQTIVTPAITPCRRRKRS